MPNALSSWMAEMVSDLEQSARPGNHRNGTVGPWWAMRPIEVSHGAWEEQ